MLRPLFLTRASIGLAATAAEAVVAHCRTGLTSYKLPRHVEFRDTLPKSPIGKVLRRELRDNRN